MNNFTKEELEDLHYYTKRYHEFNEFFQPTEFLNKIQSMVDNYCQHEWDIYRKGNIIQGIYCEKCAQKLKGYK